MGVAMDKAVIGDGAHSSIWRRNAVGCMSRGVLHYRTLLSDMEYLVGFGGEVKRGTLSICNNLTLVIALRQFCVTRDAASE